MPRTKTPPAPAEPATTPTTESPVLADPFLGLAADVVGDLERLRVAMDNRNRQLTRDEADSDGVERGFGLTDDHPDVALFKSLAADLAVIEAAAVKRLERSMKDHPLGPWVRRTSGLGNKQMARLLATIGDPYWRTEVQNEDGSVRHPEGPRTVSALWAYCGLRVTPEGEAVRRKRGVRSNWNPDAKVRVWLVAVSCVKATTSPYRQVYLDRRARTAVTHPEWTDGHSHQDGLRIVSKAVLRDLWREAARVHGTDPDVDLATRAAARLAA